MLINDMPVFLLSQEDFNYIIFTKQPIQSHTKSETASFDKIP